MSRPEGELIFRLEIQRSEFKNQNSKKMAINYKVSKCKNPKGVEGTDYYSNKAKKTSDHSSEGTERGCTF